MTSDTKIELDQATRDWLENIGFRPRKDELWVEALTHGSSDTGVNYERLEFLGDRVLGLSIAAWLFEILDTDEGRMSRRLNALVSRENCARIAQRINLPGHILMGKQAREDGGTESTNILGDVMEALLGASFMESGFATTRDIVRSLWAEDVEAGRGEAKHPKSALQEWAAGNKRAPPSYEVVDRSGPDHAAKFTVRVSIHKVGEAQAIASSKQEAETRAAEAFLERFA